MSPELQQCEVAEVH